MSFTKLSLYLVYLFFGVFAYASYQCPDKIRYPDGSYLKKGDNYYYPDYVYLIKGDLIYYPSGQYLKSSSKIYYPDGKYLQYNDRLYYPSGSYLKKGDYYYWANGNYLKKNSYFYYSDNSYARRNGKLYRPDGSETVFPIKLNENIGEWGTLTAEVSTNSDHIEIEFKEKFIETTNVDGFVLWNGEAFTQFEFVIRTGIPGEQLLVQHRNNKSFCYLMDENSGPMNFTLHARAATVNVRVNPGYNPDQVRYELRRALDLLGN